MKGPSATNTNLRVGQQVNIVGCILHSSVTLNAENMHWLKDGKIKISKIFSSRISISSFGNKYTYSELKYAITNHSMQGYYQCVVFDPKYISKEVKSTAVTIQFQGNRFVYR